MARSRLSNDQRQAIWKAAAAKAAATRRARASDAGSSAPEALQPIEAGRKQNYPMLDTDTLLGLLPGEQRCLDRWLGGMHGRYTFARLAAIERELAARNVTVDEMTAWRFGAADPDSDAARIAERVAQLDDREPSLDALTFNPEEFAA